MIFSLDDYLETVAPQLPPALLAQSGLAAIRRIARELPPCSLVGFESALATPDASADFAVGLVKDAPTSEAHARRISAARHAAPQLNSPGWARLGDFLSVWSDPITERYADAGTVWLEWDVNQTEGQIPAPNVLFGVNCDRSEDLADDGLRRLLGRPLSPAARIQLARCFTALSGHTRVFQVGAMLARQVDGVRVCIYPVRIAQAIAFLGRIGWPGALDELERTLMPFDAFPVNMALDVDVGAGVGPRIGLECYLDERRHSDLDPRWATFLDYLVDQGICTEAKRTALLAWPGRQTSTQFMWPRTFIRGLNHIKLVYAPRQPLSAKAYWGFTHVWASATAAAEAAQPEPNVSS